MFTLLLWLPGCHPFDIASNQETEPIESLEVEVVGYDYRLYFRYPGNDRILDTKDDRFGTRDLCVPVGASVQLRLVSRDFVYLVELPAVGVYEAAVPGLDSKVQFTASTCGQYELLASQMCGYDHEELLGKLVVQSSSDYHLMTTNLSNAPLIKATK